MIDRLERLRYGLEKPGQDRGFAVFPLVYCVAYNETYKTRFYEKLGARGYRKRELSRDLMKLLDREDHYYIRATGSCKGDSGGPLYELVDDQEGVKKRIAECLPIKSFLFINCPCQGKLQFIF